MPLTAKDGPSCVGGRHWRRFKFWVFLRKTFLGWPDQGLAGMLKSQSAFVLARLRYLVMEWGSTDVVGPDVRDRHRDHRALGLMLERLFSGGGLFSEKFAGGPMWCMGVTPDFTATRRPCRKRAFKLR